MFIDTHAHLYLDQFQDDIDLIINKAIESKVEKIFLPNIDSSTTEAMLNLQQRFPDVCYPMIGLHPCSVKADFKNEIDHIEKELIKGKFYGIGETGVDLYWDVTYKAQQVSAFEAQIELARKLDLPIIIHSRDSLNLTIDMIENNQDGHIRGIFHCFNGDKAQAKKVMDCGFMVGLGGVITFKNAKLDEMVAYLAEERILLETDAPYLSPVPYRGKRNESSYIPIVAAKVADIRNVEINAVSEFTTSNAKKLFRI